MNSHVRSVSFVENLQLEITESLFNESLLLSDVDNDGDYELIVGQFNGDLVIFKGSSHKPWRICHHLGMITCVGAGDLKNNGENVLFCITAEGWCHIFHVRFLTKELEYICFLKNSKSTTFLLVLIFNHEGLSFCLRHCCVASMGK